MIRHPALRLATFVLLVAALFVLATRSASSPEQLRRLIETWGVGAPLIYCLVGAALKVGCVPLAVIAGGAGVMFGVELGFPVALIAATAGSGITFTIGRWLGRTAVDELQGDRLERVRGWITERGLVAVIGARLAPIPSQIVNYAGGLTTLPLRTFLIGSLLGFAPRTFAYVAVGDSLDQPASLLWALGLLAVIVVGGVMIARRARRLRPIS
jgi:uncharacterized membrane protein YdjX (TVP38/TMEM64 family)